MGRELFCLIEYIILKQALHKHWLNELMNELRVANWCLSQKHFISTYELTLNFFLRIY